MTLRATSRAHDVQVQSGSAWLEPGAGAKRDGKAELIGPKAKGSLLRLPGHTSAGAVEACEQAANQALELAKRLLGEPPSTGMGDAAAEHMRLRSKARQACLVAEAGLGLAKEPGDAKELRERVARANERWQRVPSRANQGHEPFGAIHLPPEGSWMVGPLDLTPTKHVVFLWLTGAIVLLMFLPAARRARERTLATRALKVEPRLRPRARNRERIAAPRSLR